MSAFIVNDKHLDAILAFAIEKRASYFWNPRRIDITTDSVNEIGQILLDENYRSVNHRYRNEHGEATVYKYKRPKARFEPVDILKAINCLDYQSCETEDWPQTQAWAVLDGIKDCAIRNLPGYETSCGWNL